MLQPRTLLLQSLPSQTLPSPSNTRTAFIWRRNMETQLRALGQWEVVLGTVTAPVPAIPNQPTPDEIRRTNAWTLRSARAYAEIALRLDDEYGETIATTSEPHDAWTMLETSYGAQQSGIQSVINAELTLAKWDGKSPITAHRDHMKTLRTRLANTTWSSPYMTRSPPTIHKGQWCK